jgi:ribosome-associated protein
MSRIGVLEVTDGVSIPRAELEYRASRAGGAGGQHVNTSSTRVEVRWNVAWSRVLDDEARNRVATRLASRIDGEGWIRVVSSARRSQQQNREAAEARLAELVRAALVVQKRRRPTKPTRASKEARIAQKKRRGETKRQRHVELD